jgi:hypothetical protein
MSLWTAIVVIAIVAIMADLWKAKHRARHGITTDWMGGEKPIAPPTNSALEREDEELRERVKVLERIATEDRDSKRLSAEIESLREEKGNLQ